MICLGGSIAVHVSLSVSLPGVGGSESKSGALIVEVISSGVAFGISVCVALNSHFLRKPWFLSVILSDPLTLIQYWQSDRTVMIFLVVFNW